MPLSRVNYSLSNEKTSRACPAEHAAKATQRSATESEADHVNDALQDSAECSLVVRKPSAIGEENASLHETPSAPPGMAGAGARRSCPAPGRPPLQRPEACASHGLRRGVDACCPASAAVADMHFRLDKELKGRLQTSGM